MRGDELSERFLDYAARAMRVAEALPKRIGGRHVASQLLRSATSTGAHYEEARGAESRSDFIHKLAICWKETRESCYWLKLVQKAQLLKPARVEALQREAEELSRILSKSLATARSKKDS